MARRDSGIRRAEDIRGHCVRMSEDHGGQIEIESGDPRGTTLRLTLPIANTGQADFRAASA